jgi:hypothetical protein
MARSSGQGRRAAAAGGIGARGGKRQNPGSGKAGKPAPAGATGSTAKSAFGIKTGSAKAMATPRKRTTGPVSNQPPSPSAAATGSSSYNMSGHVPNHTFASATMPRGDQMRKMAAAKYDPDGDGDNDATPSGDTDHDYWSPSGVQLKPLPGKPLDQSPKAKAARAAAKKEMAKAKKMQAAQGNPADECQMSAPETVMPTKTNELAAPQQGMIAKSHKGLFTAKAKSAGMSVQAYAAHVLGAKKGTFDPATVQQANFARNFGGAAKAKAK